MILDRQPGSGCAQARLGALAAGDAAGDEGADAVARQRARQREAVDHLQAVQAEAQPRERGQVARSSGF